MQAKKRYFLVTSFGIALLLSLGFIKDRHGDIPLSRSVESESAKGRSYMDEDDYNFGDDLHISAKQRRMSMSPRFGDQPRKHHGNTFRKDCRMETCFDFNRCHQTGKYGVYVYPELERVSSTYSKILTVIRESRYYTADPAKACIFVLSMDTLDRDVLSRDFVKDVQMKLDKLELWNNGRNHIIFNLYSGTWPDYAEDLGFNIGEAMLAKASISRANFRPGFDVSIPLFAKDHPLKGGEPGHLHVASNSIPSTRQYILSFKGKRYVIGIGSETRNSLYHIHNGRDIVLLTTCKHGKDWQNWKDERCEKDNAEFDRYDYKKLLYNATFCLVPRGRRLGSFRYLEALQAACVPVLLSNGWILPFSEVIDWNKSVIWGDERLLLQVPSIVRSIPEEQILSLQQQTQFLWQTYFSNVEKIVTTVLEILKDRIYSHMARNQMLWNTMPGAHFIMPEYSDAAITYPFYYKKLGRQPSAKFTAVIYAISPVMASSSSLFRLVRNVAKSASVHKILVIWHCDVSPPPPRKWPSDLAVPILVKTRNIKTISSRFFPYRDIETDAVFSLDEDVLLTTDEIDFAFSVWKEFPERIVGYPARNHYWDDLRSKWSYTSKWTNDYSMVLTGAAIYHRYYNYLYTHLLNSYSVKSIVDQMQNCEDILLNFLVSHVTNLPPVKVTQRKLYKESMIPNNNGKSSVWLNTLHFVQRQSCIHNFTNAFGYMPLIRSNLRMDPILFKDPVSNLRKKYRQIELV